MALIAFGVAVFKLIKMFEQKKHTQQYIIDSNDNCWHCERNSSKLQQLMRGEEKKCVNSLVSFIYFYMEYKSPLPCALKRCLWVQKNSSSFVSDEYLITCSKTDTITLKC